MLSEKPWELTAAGYRAPEKDLGPDKAMFTFWCLCRGLNMTRVSDGFAPRWNVRTWSVKHLRSDTPPARLHRRPAPAGRVCHNRRSSASVEGPDSRWGYDFIARNGSGFTSPPVCVVGAVSLQ